MFPDVLRERVAVLIDDPLVFRGIRVTSTNVPGLQSLQLRIDVEPVGAREFGHVSFGLKSEVNYFAREVLFQFWKRKSASEREKERADNDVLCGAMT